MYTAQQAVKLAEEIIRQRLDDAGRKKLVGDFCAAGVGVERVNSKLRRSQESKSKVRVEVKCCGAALEVSLRLSTLDFRLGFPMPMVVANRYARALADVVAASGDYRKVLQELQDFESAYRESRELREVFASPAVTLPQKMKVLEAIGRRLGESPVTLNFLRVLLANYRMPLLEEAVQAYRKIANDRLGVVQVTISSASDLSRNRAGKRGGAIPGVDWQAGGTRVPNRQRIAGRNPGADRKHGLRRVGAGQPGADPGAVDGAVSK